MRGVPVREVLDDLAAGPVAVAARQFDDDRPDQAVLLQKGTVTYDGKAADLMATSDLRATYLG